LIAVVSWHGQHLPQPGQPEGSIVLGTVVDEQAGPVAGVKVTISSSEGFTASALTQTDGKFEFRKLATGQYRVVAEVTGFRKERTTIAVNRIGETVSLLLKLRPSSLHVAVFDAGSREPLSGVRVTLAARERAGPNPAPAVAARAVTDEGGDAYFGRLATGSYQLTAGLRGYDEYRSMVFISSERITTEFALPLSIAPIIPINEKSTTRYSVPNLPSKNVLSIFQDSDGWLWLGTDKGVARFNGADFKSSAAAGSPYPQLAGLEVRSIAEDKEGTIWLATSRGVRRVSRTGADLGELLVGYDVRHVLLDSQGSMWAATAAGEFKFDGQGMTPFDQSRGIQSNDVRATTEDNEGRILIATSRGVSVIQGTRVSTLVMASAEPRGTADNNPREAPRDAAMRRPVPRAEAIGGSDDVPAEVTNIFASRDGKLWLATPRGVVLYDRKSAPTVVARASGPGAADFGVRVISEDSSGRLWFGLRSSGAMLYDPVRRETQRINILDRDRVAAIFTDREENVWVGTDNGAVRADFYSFVDFNTSRGLADNDVLAITQVSGKGQRADSLWFATTGGVSTMNGERMQPLEGFRANVPVRGIAIDREGSAWFATEQGVFRLSDQSLTQLNEGNGLVSNNVNWVGSIYGGTAMLMATAKGVSIFKDGALAGLDQLSGYDVRHLLEDTDGRLWFSTARGIVVFDPQTEASGLFDTGRGLADNDVRCIVRAGDKLIVAGRGGVQAMTTDNRSESPFSAIDGEPSTALLVDRDGYLWTGTDDGQLKKFVLAGHQPISTVYSGETSALAGKRINNIYQDAAGLIWIATAAGAVRHIPSRAAPLAQISLEVDGRAVPPDEAHAAEGSAVYDLPYGGHKYTFHFSGVSLDGQVRYLYRLKQDGREDPWESLPVQQSADREVSLSDIGEGASRFEVKALNRDLYGVSESGVALTLRIGPPFWNRWWFYSLLTALAAVLLAGFVYAYRLRTREYVLPRELRSYVPIEPNPYIVGNPIRTKEMFFGREDDFRYVRTKLESANQGVVVVFCGERRVGKSSILYQVLNGRLGPRFIPVFVDMQEMVVASDSELFARISRLIGIAIERAATEFSEPEMAAEGEPAASAPNAAGNRVIRRLSADHLRPPVFDGRNPYPVFVDFLDDVLNSLGDRTLLILIDEYELVEAKVDEGKLSHELFTFLAGLMDNKERLALIFTGSRRLEERDRKYWRELLRRSLFRKVGFLSENDTLRLILEPVRGRVVYGRGVADQICRLTAGQPFYTQVICQNLVDYLNEHRHNGVALADLTAVIDDIVDNPLPQMIYSWDGLSDDERIAISLLAERLAEPGSYGTAAELFDAIRLNNYPVHLSEATLRLTLEEMFRREILDKDAADGFRFKMDLLRLWVRRAHSIWQVVNEVRTL
jgi:ligand-binding sensor domain-containing protein